MPTTAATGGDWGTAIVTSVAAALAMFMEAIPKVIGFLVILLIGWFIAAALARVVSAILRTVRFNELAERAGLSGFVAQMGLHTDAAGFVALTAEWFVRLIVLVSAFDALGLPAVSQVFQQLLLWLPNLVVAIIALVIGGLAANALGRLVRGATAESGLGDPDLLGTLARIAVWAFAIVVAVNQLGIATSLVNTLFMAVVGGFALALGLAFGLGGRETAALIVRNWYERSQWTPRHIERPTPGLVRKPEDREESEAAGPQLAGRSVGRAEGAPGGAHLHTT
jgi:Conserved TM helix